MTDYMEFFFLHTKTIQRTINTTNKYVYETTTSTERLVFLCVEYTNALTRM